jgi:hypothetical protein
MEHQFTVYVGVHLQENCYKLHRVAPARGFEHLHMSAIDLERP